MNIDDLIKAIEDMRPYVDKLRNIIDEHYNILIVGNGGSNAIASHAASDLTNILHKNARAFTDATILTCYINDYGMEDAYLRWIQGFDPDYSTLVILISSSGNSNNIVNCAKWCSKQRISFITLSGFEEDNKLNNVKNATLNVWVDSKSYGVVECTHGNFLHSVIDI